MLLFAMPNQRPVEFPKFGIAFVALKITNLIRNCVVHSQERRVSGPADRLRRRRERGRHPRPPAAPLRGGQVLVQLHVHARVEG